MTVAELIEILQRCPRDAEILVSDNELGHVGEPGAWLVDAYYGPLYDGGRDEVVTEAAMRNRGGPNCKAVVISRFGEDGEAL